MSLKDEGGHSTIATAETPLVIERDGRVMILTLNRPAQLNALTPELHRLLHSAVIDAADDATIGAVILTGDRKSVV